MRTHHIRVCLPFLIFPRQPPSNPVGGFGSSHPTPSKGMKQEIHCFSSSPPHPHPSTSSGHGREEPGSGLSLDPAACGLTFLGALIFCRPVGNGERQAAGMTPLRMDMKKTKGLRGPGCLQPPRLLRPGSDPSPSCLPQSQGGLGAVWDLIFWPTVVEKPDSLGEGGAWRRLGVSHEPQSLVAAEPVIQTILTLQ